MTFQYPSSPILSQPENTLEDLICSLERRSKMCENTPVFCECVQILELSPKKIVDLIFINEGELFGNKNLHEKILLNFSIKLYNTILQDLVVILRSLFTCTATVLT